MEGEQAFAYHRGMAPIMWVFLSLALIELGVVHLLVALRWPAIGWPLSILSAIGVVWIVLLIRSFARYPHRIEGDTLVLHLGNMRRIALALADISAVEASWESGGDKAADALKLSGIAYPNRCLLLAKDLPRGKRRVFVRLDDPQAFDATLAERGVPVSVLRR